MNSVDEIFGALPIEAQNYCNEQWKAAFEMAQSRHLVAPDPEQKAATDDLVRLFFVQGYVTAMREAKKTIDEVQGLIRENIDESS